MTWPETPAREGAISRQYPMAEWEPVGEALAAALDRLAAAYTQQP